MLESFEGVSISIVVNSLTRLVVTGLLKTIILLSPQYALSQESRTSLARPDWQLRAELEFKLRLQQANRELCGELFEEMETAEIARNANIVQSLRQTLPNLMKLVDDQPPTALPDTLASIAYLDSRQAAFADYTKALNEHSRQPTAEIVAREAAMQKELRASLLSATSVNDSAANSTNPVSNTAQEPLGVAAASKSTGTVAHQTTVRSMATCMLRLLEFSEFDAAGDTSAEKSRVLAFEERKVQDLIQKQKEWVLHYPIQDVIHSSKSMSITLKVDQPLEFAQVQLENPDLQVWTSSKSSWITSLPSIVRRMDTIKPGDYLRITVPITLYGKELFEYNRRTLTRTEPGGRRPVLDIAMSDSSSRRAPQYEIIKRRESKPSAVVDSRYDPTK